jgi:hypothetical protein
MSDKEQTSDVVADDDSVDVLGQMSMNAEENFRLRKRVAELEEKSKKEESRTDTILGQACMNAEEIMRLRNRIAELEKKTGTDLQKESHIVTLITTTSEQGAEIVFLKNKIDELRQRIKVLEASDDLIDKRIDGLEEKVSTMHEKRLEMLEAKLDASRRELKQRVEDLEEKYGYMVTRAERLEAVTGLADDNPINEEVAGLQERIETLEKAKEQEAARAFNSRFMTPEERAANEPGLSMYFDPTVPIKVLGQPTFAFDLTKKDEK